MVLDLTLFERKALRGRIHLAYMAEKKDTGILCFTACHFIVLFRYFIFLQIKGLWQQCKSTGAILPTLVAPFAFQCNILVIFEIFQILHQQKYYDSLKTEMMGSNF